MKKILDKCKNIYNKEIPLKIEWIGAGLLSLIMLVMFYYIDLKSVTIWSTNIWDCIADGDITQYYSYTGLNIYNVHHQYVSGPLFNVIFWAIWNIPIWICQRFMGKVIIENALLLLWSKLFLVFVLGITLTITYKTCKLLFKDKKKSLWITYFASTFVFTYIGVFYTGQTDILTCMFAILGLYCLIKDKNILFYIFSAFAISIKYFYLIPYIPIILLTEKNIWNIIAKIGIGIFPIVLFTALVRNFPMYNASSQDSSTGQILKGFFESGIPAENGSKVSFFVLSFIVVCFMAYITKPKSEEQRNHYAFYFSVIPIMLMFMFSTAYEFYRPIMLMPMLIILYGFKPELFRINILLDMIFSAVSLAFLLISNRFIFASQYSMNGTLLTEALKIKEVNSLTIYQVVEKIFKDNIYIVQNLSMTIVFAVLAIMIVINHPNIKIKLEEREKPEKIERWIIWIRSVLLVPVIVFLLINIK